VDCLAAQVVTGEVNPFHAPGRRLRPMDSRFLLFVASSAVFVTALLLLDRDGLTSQLALGIATALFPLVLRPLFGGASGPDHLLHHRGDGGGGRSLARMGTLFVPPRRHPFYVPPGHGLFYTLAATTALQPAVRLRAAAIARWTLLSGTIIAIVSLTLRHDVWGFLWWIGAVALIFASKNRLLLSACFVYTIILEWVGTAIGNWRWAAEVPFLRLHSANPPVGVGILYILLDLIVVAITGRLVPWGEIVGVPQGAKSREAQVLR
jgi:hypothetical protein